MRLTSFPKRCDCFSSLVTCLNSKGQALVEFTFVFILLLVVAWIPADFGLAFYTGEQAQNASREGARIAAADTTLITQLGGAGSISCTMPCSSAANVLQVTAARISSALLPGATVTLTYPSNVIVTGSCNNQMLTVQVQGTYNFFFYQLLRLLNISGNLDTANITRVTTMRWEHQTPCNPF
jgi:Flp pilus assembly protein TadG